MRVSSCVLKRKVKYIDATNPSGCLEAVYLKRFEENGIGATDSDAARACEQFKDLPKPTNAKALAITILCIEEPELAQKCTDRVIELEEIVDINATQAEEFEHSNEPQSFEAIEAKLDDFEKEKAAIAHVPKAADAWKRVEDFPEQFKLKFLKSLDAGTRQDTKAIVVSILSDHKRSERPYEKPELNDAFEEAKLLGEEAVAEFRRLIDLLDEPKSISKFLDKIEDKFASSKLYNQLERPLRAEDEKEMISGFRALGYEVSEGFNGNWSSMGSTFYVYKLMKGDYVMNLSGASDLKTL